MMRVAVFNDTRAGGHYGCYGVMQKLHTGLAARDLHPVFHWPVGRDWRQARDQLPPRDEIDALIVNGEGSIHHSKDRPLSFFLAELAALGYDYYRVPSFLINATLYQNEPEVYHLASRFDGIFVRDSGSLDELNRHGVKGRVVPDLTVALPGIDCKQHDATRKGIGVTDSVRGGYSKMLRNVAKNIGGDFVPMEVRARPSLRTATRPFKFVKRLGAYALSLPEAKRRPRNVKAFMRWLHQKELVITGRYHTVTMCLRTRTPFIALESNTPKIRWLLNDVFGDTKRLISGAEELGDAEILDLKEFTSDEQRKLEQFLRSAEVRVEAMFDEIAEATRTSRRNFQ